MLSWASRMFTYNARPPDPQVVGERWRTMWFDRMEHTPPFIDAWLRHQRRDAFWKHGSVCEDFAGIRCPVYAVGGWADAYTNAVLRLLSGLPGPRKGLIGPWPHQYPELETALPGPQIGFLQECLRWWDNWLKGIDTGIMDEPMLRVWMQDSVEPHVFFAGYTERPGRWVSEPDWPSPRIGSRVYALNPQSLDDLPAPPSRLDIRGAQSCGLDAGIWCPYGLNTDWPPDQRAEDGLSLCFTSAPVAEPMEILGFPTVTLEVAADRPCALVAVRLCDVAPTGVSTLVTRGLLNLTHRESHEAPTALEPGRRYTVTVQLNAIAHVLPVGHRWRLAISPTYWPWAWPSPDPVTLGIFTGGTSALRLPVRPPQPEDRRLAPFDPPEGTPAAPTEVLSMAVHCVTLRRDVAVGRFELTDHHDGPHVRLRESGREYNGSYTCTYSIVEGDPLSACATCESSSVVGRGGWQTRVVTSSVLSADEDTFHVTCVLHGYEGLACVYAKTWTFAVPRDLV
jgi:predicted acyl esterase